MTTTIGGTTGVTFPDASTQNTAATGFGFKNRIINGAMGIWQRGTSFTLSAGVTTYTADRWYVNTTGGAGVVSQTGSVGAYSLRISGASGVTSGFFGQKVESVNIADCAGSTITYKIRASSSVLTSLTWYARYPNSQDNYAGVTSISNGTINITSTPTDYTFQITLPSGANNGFEVYFTFGAFTSGTLDITLVQLEKGSTATSFDYRPHGTELTLCQRYYCKTFPQEIAPAQNTSIYGGSLSNLTGSSAFTGNATVNWRYPVVMRTTPTISIYTPGATGSGRFTDSGGGSVAASATNTGDASTMIYSSGGAANVNSYAYVHAAAAAEL